MEFRDAVKQLRSELGLTQNELATALHVNYATVGRWENGRTLPTRSITSVLMDFARSEGVSKECLDTLKHSIDSAARERLLQLNGHRAQTRYATGKDARDRDITDAAALNDRVMQWLDTMPSGLAVIEVDPRNIAGSLRTTFYNDRFFSFSGYTREEYDAILKANELSFVFGEDTPRLIADTGKICAGEVGNAVNTTLRCHTKDGGFRWMLLTGQLDEVRGNICVIKVSMVDITARKEAEDRRRISEQMLRIAAETDKRAIITYDVKANTCHVESRNLYSAKFGETLENIPGSLIDTGICSPDSAAELCGLFESVRSGKESVRTSLLLRTGNNEYQWFECNASTVPDINGKPDHAVLVLHNITDQRVKEAVFRKWQQSIESRAPETYTLFRCNLSRDAGLDEQEGELLKIEFPPGTESFNSRTKAYVERFVCPEDREAYSALLDSDTLLAMFYRGEHTAELEYREENEDGEAVWRLLTVEMVEYLNSSDIQVFLMYEDIDEKKKAELKEKELAQTDPLTGVLNRVAFAEKVDALISREAGAQHALLMMDMDGFKQLNDTFGHAAGDQALMDITAVLRSLMRDGDLICRLGGDEFFIWLRGIPYDAVIDKIAQQMCEQVRKAFSHEVEISASVGIAVYPRDGHDFDELYHNADKAMYKVKQAGKNNYAFFSASEYAEPSGYTGLTAESASIVKSSVRAKRRMLIVDDDGNNRSALKSVFKDEYMIETAKNGAEAMFRLRHFGTAVSVMLLDLDMPGTDGYGILRKMQSSVELRTIPVIVIGNGDDQRALLKAIEYGAADYVTKPVDTELIRIRVLSAVSKAENERLRAQNSYLQLQRDEELKFHTVLESTGTVVIEYDWRNHVFVYDNEISKHIAGSYNHRSLWQVFLSDMVADSADVKAIQDGLLSLANNHSENKFGKLLMLRTPSDKKHWFRMNVYKQVDAFGLAEKMIITFNDVHEEVLANERLLFQATRDELTGLYNRAGFIEKAAELIAGEEPGYYVMSCLDIEEFKVINDQYGVEKGDEVLRGFADVLKGMNGGRDVICCRVTADNFAVLYPARLLNTPEVISTHNASEILDGSLPPLKICVGRCIVDDKTLDVSAIYDRATIAMNTVKGRFDAYAATFDESMRTALLRQQEITGQMRQALAEGQFEVWLQPQFNHTTGMLSGAEALVRWRHPKEGIISPAEFIPIFERNGFVYEVDKFVWEQTCILLRKWLDKGLKPVPVSVNISRYDVFRDDLVKTVKGLVSRYELPIDLLRLEITESAFTKSSEQIIRVVKEFVELGFIVEIDDFGSGYSSLNTLKDVPAQVLKMDMRFLENDSNAQRGGSIIESVVRMARWLGMSVIAEGVETAEQADYLKSIGCEYVQGYLYSRPAQATEYEKLFTGGKTDAMPGRLRTVESWNNNAFWNPKSIETLIFNSYIGGACIFEYNNGKTELLRYNDSYAEVFRPFIDQDHMSSRRDLSELLDAENAAIVRDNIETAIRTKKEASCESRFTNADGRELYVRTTVRLIARTGDRYLFYCVVSDITARKKADERLCFVNELASEILSEADNDKAIENTLGRLMTYFGAQRSYIVELDHVRGISVNTYEVCAEGVSSEKARLRSIPFGENDFWYSSLIQRHFFTVRNTEELEDRELRELLLSQNIHSLVLAPLRRDGQLIGFVGVDNPSKLPEEVERLSAPADYLAILLTRRDLNRDVERGIADMKQLINDTPGGFCRMTLRHGAPPALVALNEGFCRLLGMTEQEVRAEYSEDMYKCFVMEDVRASVKEARNARASEKQYSAKCRIRRKDGRTVWVMAFGRFAADASGNTFLNVYFTDITEQKNADELRVSLMDKLACGVAMYELDGSRISVVHINKSYWKLVGREPVDYTQSSIIDVVHPDDRPVLLQEMNSCIHQDRDFSCDLRVKNGKGGYTPFHLAAAVERKKDGKYLFYATYTPISDEAMSVQEMLPIMLSTVMTTSEDISFIKDQDGRYAACSKTAVSAFGLESERDIIGKTSIEVFGAETVRRFEDEDRLIYKTGKPMLDRLIRLPARNGSATVYSASKYPLLDGAGRVVGIYSICRDVTAEKATEFELNTLLRVIPSGVIKYSADEKSEFAYVNHRFIEALGYTEERFREKFHNRFSEMVWAEDRESAEKEIFAQENGGGIGRFDYRIQAADGELRWFHDEGVRVTDENGREWYYVTLVDITAQKRSEASLRLAEEEYRLATRHSGHTIGRYDVKAQTLTITEDAATRLALPECIPDVPYGRVRLGKISEDTADAYIAFYENIMKGEKEGSVTFRKLLSGGWRWITEHSTTIFDEENKPVSAIISYKDVTEQQEKELAYKHWQQSMECRDPKTYTLLRCNLNRNTTFDIKEGELLCVNSIEQSGTFNDKTAAYAGRFVYESDRERYVSFVNSDTMLAEYYRSHRTDSIEYREMLPDGNVRWLKLTVDLVESPSSTDVEAYMLYENIDERKKSELATMHMAQTDPLTGLLNRKTFSERAEALIRESGPGIRHAFIMLDIDGFKMLNDTFGHAAGDDALVETSVKLQTMLRRDDILGRLGGDEFVIFLNNISDDMSIEKKTELICRRLFKVYNSEVQLSASVGVSVYPDDGADLHTLYEKADTALYAAKEGGRNTFRLYSPDMPEKSEGADSHDMVASITEGIVARTKKRRMLIVDDSEPDRELLKKIFEGEYLIDIAADGMSALARMRYFGTSLSVVLLDLNMKGMGGFEVLEKAGTSAEMRTVPIIVVSGEDDSETCLRAIRSGAADFITKPVDRELLCLRVNSAISHAENERLRAQNSFLQMQGEGLSRYQAALNAMNMFVVELDCMKDTFVYDSSISQYLGGTYDGRDLWRIFGSDSVADAGDTERLHDFLRALAGDEKRNEDSIELPFRTPSGETHMFRLRATKASDGCGPAQKLIVTFKDMVI